MSLLLITGILTPSEGLSGFSNPATLTVAAMFVLSEGLRRTGMLNKVGDFFARQMKQNFWLGFLGMLLFISISSSFINNTAVVVIFIPVLIDIASKIDVSPSKLLMPLSFAGIFGGICTLIGTSTNILVSSIAEDRGLQSFSMFEFAPAGVLFVALPILTDMVLSAALGFVPIVVSAITGVILMILTGCISPDEAYQAVNWKVVLLLAGVIPLGTAMDKTGAASMMANTMISVLSDFGPRAIMSGFFLLTHGHMSNNVSAALLAPIAIQTADSLGVTFLFAVTYAASHSFVTPFGYQTNTLIYGAGSYKFTDFTKIGLPLNILFWILATIIVPVIWPF